jgi:hypothetical protein
MGKRENDLGGDALEGDFIPAIPEATRTAFNRRPSLTNARGIRRELASVYMEFRRGELTTDEAKTSGFLLRCLLESVRTDEIERRIAQLEGIK